MEQVGPMPYTALQTILDAAAVPHRRYYMRSNFIADPGEAAAALAESYARTPSPLNAVLLTPFGGAVARVPVDETAFYHRDAAYSMTLLGCWQANEDDAANIAWLRSTWDTLGPYLSEGVYVNELYMPRIEIPTHKQARKTPPECGRRTGRRTRGSRH
jgi:hypothetical protein